MARKKIQQFCSGVVISYNVEYFNRFGADEVLAEHNFSNKELTMFTLKYGKGNVLPIGTVIFGEHEEVTSDIKVQKTVAKELMIKIAGILNAEGCYCYVGRLHIDSFHEGEFVVLMYDHHKKEQIIEILKGKI